MTCNRCGGSTAKQDVFQGHHRYWIDCLAHVQTRLAEAERQIAAMFPRVFPDEHLQKTVAQAEKDLAPDVGRIRYNFGEDADGQDCVYFRVVLSNEAGKRLEICHRVRDYFYEHIPGSDKRFRYFNYRSQAETEQLQDPEWV